MAIVGEPCNVDVHAKILALFITMLCLCCAHVVCTVQLYTLTVTVLYSCLVDYSEHRIHPGDTTHHTHTRQSQMLSSGSHLKIQRSNNHHATTAIFGENGLK